MVVKKAGGNGIHPNLNEAQRPWAHSLSTSIARLRTIVRMTDTDILENFGKRVRMLREKGDWSQEEFAQECDLDRSYFGAVERGKRNLSLKNIERIAIAFDISVSELLEGI